MALEPVQKSSAELWDEVVCKIDAYLDGTLSPEAAREWAKPFFARQWLSSEILLEDAIATLACVGPDEYDTSPDELCQFRSHILGESWYVVHFRGPVKPSKKASGEPLPSHPS